MEDPKRVLQDALDAAGYEAVAIRTTPMGGSNEIFAVTLTDRRIVIARIPRRGIPRFQMERAVMSAAREAGIPVPEVLEILNEEGPEAPIMLLSHVRGLPLDAMAADLQEEERTIVSLAAGRALGMIHSLNVGTGYGNLDDDLQGSSESLEGWFIQQLEPAIERAEEALHGDDAALAGLHRTVTFLTDNRDVLAREDAVLLHGDYRPGNLLFDDSDLTGVIDWEAAKRGPAALDFGWWDWAVRHSSPAIAADALVDGYLQVRPLDMGSLDELRAVTLARITIGHLDWAVRSGHERVEKDARTALRAYSPERNV